MRSCSCEECHSYWSTLTFIPIWQFRESVWEISRERDRVCWLYFTLLDITATCGDEKINSRTYCVLREMHRKIFSRRTIPERKNKLPCQVWRCNASSLMCAVIDCYVCERDQSRLISRPTCRHALHFVEINPKACDLVYIAICVRDQNSIRGFPLYQLRIFWADIILGSFFVTGSCLIHEIKY